MSAVVSTCMIWAIFPLTDKSFKTLPLPGWYPFNTKTSPNYEITYAYQIVCTTFNGVLNAAHDLYATGLIMIICSQLNILNDSLINIKSEAEELSLVTPNLTFEDAMNIKLLECVENHKCILEFAKEFSVLFTISILGQFVVSVIIICTTMFEMTLIPFMSLKFVSLVLYQYCMLMEIFILCYFGNEVIIESNKLTNFAYHSDWLIGSCQYRKNLLFFMIRSQRTLKLYAGGFFTLSLDTFVSVSIVEVFHKYDYISLVISANFGPLFV
nr:unnamed protein product [Callosobruchus analis]